jgi:hypothetical protein
MLGLGALQSFASIFTGGNPMSSLLLPASRIGAPGATTLTPESDESSSDSDLSAIIVEQYDKNGKKRRFDDRIADWKKERDAKLKKKGKNKPKKKKKMSPGVVMYLDSSEDFNNNKKNGAAREDEGQDEHESDDEDNKKQMATGTI